MLERKKYAASGSGTDYALNTMDQFYNDNMSSEEAIRLGVRAIEAGKRRDIYSGGKSVTVFVIDRQGVREIPQSQVLKLVQELNEPVVAKRPNAR